MTNRQKIILEILEKAGDEIKTKQDALKLAMLTDNQLIKQIKNINNYILKK
jgi:hypothetical protein